MFRFLILISVFASCSAFASNYSLGVGITHFDYSEFLAAPSKSNEAGDFPTMHVQFNSGGAGDAFASGFVFSAALDASLLANLRYDGSTLSSGSGTSTPVTTTNVHFLAYLETTVGWGLTIYDINITPYVGLGYRWWNRYLTYGTGYREIYAWLYQQLGLKVEVYRSGVSSIDVDLSYRPMMSGKMNIIFSEFVSTGQDSEVSLGKKSGYKLAVNLQTSLFSTWRIFVTPWYEHSEIGQSNVVYNGTPVSGGGVLGFIYEPESRTNQYGIQLGVGKSF